MTDQPDRGGRRPEHGAYQLMRRVDAGEITPELAAELADSARELLADDGDFTKQPRRRQRLAHRLACLEMYLDTIDSFILSQGSIFVPERTPVLR